MPKQHSFTQHPAFRPYTRFAHGGDLRKNQRKLWRPLDPRRPVHLTLRSTRARGDWSMLHHKNQRKIRHLVERFAAANRVKIYKYANSGNHLHLLVHSSDFKQVLDYVLMNELEAEGVWHRSWSKPDSPPKVRRRSESRRTRRQPPLAANLRAPRDPGSRKRNRGSHGKRA